VSFQGDARAAVEALREYHEHAASRSGPVIRQPPLRDLAQELELVELIAGGGLQGERLREFLDRYLAATTRLHHPGYLAHQVAVPHPSGAIGALVDAFTNNAMAIYEMGPAAAAIEFVVVNWMLGKVGFAPAPLPPATAAPGSHGGGVLTHGGSAANLTALLAARSRADPDAWSAGARRDLVLVAPAAAHYSIARTAGILGMGQRAVRAAPTDEDGRLVPDRLPAVLRALADEGLGVLAVVADACSTAAGLYDPLREVAAFCAENGLWLHVDGAHGASALLSERLKGRLDGIDRADSVVWDAHKMLRAPTLCAAVLLRDHRDLDRAFQQEASYLFHEKDQPGFDFIHRTLECTKAGLGLRLFMVLASEGEGALARYVERQVELAAAAADRLRREPGFEVAVAPESNIVCFRVLDEEVGGEPGGDGEDALQLELRRRLLERGRHYVSTTEFRGKRWLRLAIMNPETDLGDVERLVEELRELNAP
jgi:L-2,4-diaminobutyrate decarboxylase